MHLQSSADDPLGGRDCLGRKETEMYQAALAFDQDIQAMGAISCHHHIGFPVANRSTGRGGLGPALQARSILDPLARLPIRLLWFASTRLARQKGS